MILHQDKLIVINVISKTEERASLLYAFQITKILQGIKNSHFKESSEVVLESLSSSPFSSFESLQLHASEGKATLYVNGWNTVKKIHYHRG